MLHSIRIRRFCFANSVHLRKDFKSNFGLEIDRFDEKLITLYHTKIHL